MSIRRFARPLGLTVSGLLAVAVVALVPTSAQARVAAPTGLSPKGAPGTSAPVFSWSRVPGATQYDLQISSGGDSPFVRTTTRNNHWVPVSNLPDGDFTWQVRADTPTGSSSWVTAQISISASTAPTPVSPINGTVLSQPDQPPTFTWSPITGAVGYQIQVDNSGAWTSPTQFNTSGTSYFVNTPQAPGTWYWRVRADRGSGYYTSWSDTATYAVGALPDPVPGTDMTSDPVQDVSIDWQPVPGATSYQLQVGKDADFNTIVDDQTVMGTRFQPASTYNNAHYYWRVRAIDAAGNRMPWTTAEPFMIERSWPQAPQQLYPPNQLSPAIVDPPFFQWAPVAHASRYQLDISADPNFSQYVSCTTAATTYPIGSPPSTANSCGDLAQGQTLYWRVKAIDAPTNVQGIYSAIHSFVYDAGPITLTAPDDGATKDVPTLQWDPVAGANTYSVTVKNTFGTTVAKVATPSTSWTPATKLPATGNPYTWNVVPVDAVAASGPVYPSRTFNVSGTDPVGDGVTQALTPLTGTGHSTDFPDLTWAPMPGAVYYTVTLSVHGSGHEDGTGTSNINSTQYQYPAATDTGTHYLTPGDYDWYATAYNAGGAVIGSGKNQPATFHIDDLPAVTGQLVSLDGMAARAGAGCANTLTSADPTTQVCTDVPATPTLSWEPVTGAAGYLVYLANERSITNLVTSVGTTLNTMWRPPAELPDNTAVGAYYWYVRPCKSLKPLVCSPDPSSVQNIAANAFRKQSPPVELQTPADGSTVSGAPTDAPLFTWSDYLTTNQADTDLDGSGQAPSYQAAQTYRIQIAQTANFATVLADRELDQPFFSPSTFTLPQGKIYWRVQATDANANRLAWSDTFSFNNTLPAIDLSTGSALASPVGDADVTGSTPFRWQPMNGAASYTIEVYRNDTGSHSPTNLVFSATTKEPTYVRTTYLPPSTSAYTWRVMWTDVGGKARPWSTDGRFFVRSSALSLTSPESGTSQKNNDLFFSWDPVPLASSYLLDVRDVNNASAIKQSTPATAFAPSSLADGTYTWRVTALDPNAGAIATSPWRTFSIDATAPVVIKSTPYPNGKPASRLTVQFSEKVAGVTAKSFQLHMSGKKAKLATKVKFAANHESATLIPKAKLKKGHVYTGTLTQAIHDMSGNHLVTWTWAFTV